MKALSVFVGASTGKSVAYVEATKQLGKELAKGNIKLIYGGGRLGLMGVLADTVLENGGQVIGIITKHLYEKEAHLGLSELKIVESMQKRKKQMMRLADGFMALPGGLGTLEELFEIWNASKIKIHNKPLGLLNTDNYFNNLIKFIDHSVDQGFLNKKYRELIQINANSITLLDALAEIDGSRASSAAKLLA